jgi:hypothetical protein
MRYALRPGAGFVFLLAAALMVMAFFAWGFSTPRLDRIWRMSIALRVGQKKPLSSAELHQFQQALCDHPRLAEDFLEGKKLAIISANRGGLIENGEAYLVRAAGDASGVSVEVPTGGKKERRIAIRGRTTDEEIEGGAIAGKPYTWTPQPKHDCATLIEVRGSKGMFTVGAAP